MISSLNVVRSREEGDGIPGQTPEFARSPVLSASSAGFRSAILVALAAGLSSCSWLQKGLIDRANSTIVRRDALLEANGWIPTPPLGGPSGIGDIFSQQTGQIPVPELSDCFANEPLQSHRPNVEMNLSLETGVSVALDAVGLDSQGNYESHITFSEPTHWIMPRLQGDLTEDCLQRLQRVSSDRLESMHIVNQVLMAEITEKRCGQIDESGNFIVLDAERSASLGCSLDSLGQEVLVGYQTVPLLTIFSDQDLTGATMVTPTPLPHPIEVDAETSQPEPELDIQESMPAPLFRYIQIVSGSNHSCALTDLGQIHCWGDIDYPHSLEGRFTEIAANFGELCALDIKGALSCWGDDTWVDGYERLSDISFTQIQVGPTNGCGIDEYGEIHCWGWRWRLDEPPAGSFTYVGVGTSGYRCGIRQSDSGIVCWGEDVGEFENPPPGSYKDVVSGLDYSYALSEDGMIHYWRKFKSPEIVLPEGTFTDIGLHLHGRSVCGLRTSGRISCSGNPPFDYYDHLTDPPLGVYQDLYLGSEKFHCAGTDLGEIRCWGDLRRGGSDIPREFFKELAVGLNHACGITQAGDLSCWGDNRYFQLIILNFPILE